MTRAKVKCRRKAELEIITQTQLTQHTNVETIVPPVLVGRDEIGLLRAVGKRQHLWSHIDQLQVLQMRTHKYTEVERTQISIRTILNRAALCQCCTKQHKGHDKD